MYSENIHGLSHICYVKSYWLRRYLYAPRQCIQQDPTYWHELIRIWTNLSFYMATTHLCPNYCVFRRGDNTGTSPNIHACLLCHARPILKKSWTSVHDVNVFPLCYDKSPVLCDIRSNLAICRVVLSIYMYTILKRTFIFSLHFFMVVQDAAIGGYRTIHGYGLHTKAKAAQADDLKFCANPVTKLTCHKH